MRNQERYELLQHILKGQIEDKRLLGKKSLACKSQKVRTRSATAQTVYANLTAKEDMIVKDIHERNLVEELIEDIRELMKC